MGKMFRRRCMPTRGTAVRRTGNFLNLNGMTDGIMRKGQVNASLTKHEIERNKGISRVRYVIEQYFGLTAKHQGAGRAWFTTLLKEGWNRLCQIMAFNIKRVILNDRRGEVVRAM
jgi:IS5 family transposase